MGGGGKIEGKSLPRHIVQIVLNNIKEERILKHGAINIEVRFVGESSKGAQ